MQVLGHTRAKLKPLVEALRDLFFPFVDMGQGVAGRLYNTDVGIIAFLAALDQWYAPVSDIVFARSVVIQSAYIHVVTSHSLPKIKAALWDVCRLSC